MTPLPLPRAPRSVLLVRLSARGDLVFASPLIQAVRRTYPEARLSWLTESAAADLVVHNPGLDDVIVWRRHEWKTLLRRGRLIALAGAVRAFVRELRTHRFDVAVDLHGLLRSGVVTWLSGARVRIGLGSREGSSLLMTRVVPVDAGDTRRIGSDYLYLAEQLGLDTEDFRLDVAVGAADEAFVARTVEERDLSHGYAVVVPFTTRPQKHWVEDRWPRVMDEIRDEVGLPVVLLGAPGDRPAADRIVKGAARPVVDLVGQTTLSAAAAMVRGSSLVVGVDTALTHMGSAFERPTVALFGSDIPFTLPPTPRTRILFTSQDGEVLECQPCTGKPTCDGDWTCMKLLREDQVLAAVSAVLTDHPADGQGR